MFLRKHKRVLLSFAVILLALSFLLPAASGCGEEEEAVSDIDQWISELAGADAARRQQATDSLVQAGEPAVEPLIAVFIGENQDVALLKGARDTLVLIGEPAVEPLIASLAYSGQRQATALKWKQDALAQMGEPVLEPLTAALGHEDERTRIAAVQVLGETGDSRSVQPLIQVLAEDSVVDVRVAAAESLGKIGDAGAIPALGRALGDEYPVFLAAEAAILSIKAVTGKVPEIEEAYQSCITLTVRPLTDPLGAVISPDGVIVNPDAMSHLADDDKLAIGYALNDCVEIRQ